MSDGTPPRSTGSDDFAPLVGDVVDYHDFTTRETPKAERERLGVGDLWNNAARCLKCGVTIRSRNRHDFVTCRCGALSMDGGSWYARRSFAESSAFEELSAPFDDVAVEPNG